MRILLKMTITSSAGTFDPHIKAIDIGRTVDWPPDLRMPVKDDVVTLDEDGNAFVRSVEEVWLHPLALGPLATVWLEDFISDDPEECAGVDFPDWNRVVE